MLTGSAEGNSFSGGPSRVEIVSSTTKKREIYSVSLFSVESGNQFEILWLLFAAEIHVENSCQSPNQSDEKQRPIATGSTALFHDRNQILFYLKLPLAC